MATWRFTYCARDGSTPVDMPCPVATVEATDFDDARAKFYYTHPLADIVCWESPPPKVN